MKRLDWFYIVGFAIIEFVSYFLLGPLGLLWGAALIVALCLAALAGTLLGEAMIAVAHRVARGKRQRRH